MKAHLTIRQNMGLTQKKMALLLGISREQWNHYEANRRSLPKKASLKYAILMKDFVVSDLAQDREPKNYFFYKELLQSAEKKLRKCNDSLHVLSKRMKNGLKHQDAVGQTELVASCVDATNERDRKVAGNLMELAVSKAREEVIVFFDLELKREILEFEKELLEEKIGQMRKQTEADKRELSPD